jgi:hypothetical protein
MPRLRETHACVQGIRLLKVEAAALDAWSRHAALTQPRHSAGRQWDKASVPYARPAPAGSELIPPALETSLIATAASAQPLTSRARESAARASAARRGARLYIPWIGGGDNHASARPKVVRPSTPWTGARTCFKCDVM